MRRLTPRRRVVPAAAAFVALAAAAPASAAAFTATTADPAGDGPAGADVTQVAVSYDPAGTASATWTLDSTTTHPDYVVDVTFGTKDASGTCVGGGLTINTALNGTNPAWYAAGSQTPQTAGLTASSTPTTVTVSLVNGPVALAYDCASVNLFDAAGATVDSAGPFSAATPTPTPTPTPTAPTLATLPGSLLSPAKCQKLGGSGFVRTRSVSGVGKVRLQMRSNATSKPGTPLRLTIAGGSPDDVSWKLDGKAVRGTLRSLTLKPSKLFKRTDHVITVTFVGRNGRRSSYPLAFKTLGCSSAMTATVARRKGGSVLRLRIDSTQALTSAAFPLPSSTKGKVQSTFKVRLRTALDDKTRTWIYRFVRGKVVTPAGAPKFVTGKKGPAFTGLPAQTGILRVDVGLLRAPLRKTALRSSAVIGGATKTLKTKTD